MLRKLLKYDLRAALRVFGFVWIGVLLMSGLECLLFSFDMDSPAVIITAVLTMIPYILGIMALAVFPTIYFAVRFYRGLLGREGYLMFTLPTEPWKILLSKVLSALLITVVSIMVVFIGVGIMVSGILNVAGVNISLPLQDITFSWEIVWTIVGYLASTLSGILMVYMAFCLGHLFRNHRVLWSVVMYFVMNLVISTISSYIQIGISMSDAYVSSIEEMQGLLGQSSLYQMFLHLGLSILFFFFSERILHNKLNLE